MRPLRIWQSVNYIAGSFKRSTRIVRSPTVRKGSLQTAQVEKQPTARDS